MTRGGDKLFHPYYFIMQSCSTSSKRQVDVAPNLHMIMPNIFEFTIWDLLHVTIPAPGILRCFLYLEKILLPCQETIIIISFF